MSAVWSWANVVASDTIEPIVKGDSNLSTCPACGLKHCCPGQVDKSFLPLTMVTSDVSGARDVEIFFERAAIIEANGVPREWAEGFALLCTMPRPEIYSGKRWQQLVDDGGKFLDQWGRQAAALGWQAIDVFGVDPDAPVQRYDGMGLVPLLAGRKVVDITPDIALIDCGDGIIHTFSRQKSPSLAVAVWRLR